MSFWDDILGYANSLNEGLGKYQPLIGAAGLPLSLLGSMYSQPKREKVDTRTPEQMYGIGRLQDVAREPAPQWTPAELETAAKLASMQGNAQAGARGLQVPGGGMMNIANTIPAESAMQRILEMGGQNKQLQAGGQARQQQALSQVAASPGFSLVTKPSVFSTAADASRGFGSMMYPSARSYGSMTTPRQPTPEEEYAARYQGTPWE